MKRAHVFVKGMVQGVFFRVHTRQIALKYNVKGWVRNRLDGRVEALFEGTEDNVDAVIAWCRRGPSQAVVEHLDIFDETYNGELNEFQIRYD